MKERWRQKMKEEEIESPLECRVLGCMIWLRWNEVEWYGIYFWSHHVTVTGSIFIRKYSYAALLSENWLFLILIYILGDLVNIFGNADTNRLFLTFTTGFSISEKIHDFIQSL